jgi:hypothetical protein
MIRLLVTPDKGWGLAVCLSWNDYEDGIWAECQLETHQVRPVWDFEFRDRFFPRFLDGDCCLACSAEPALA